MNAINRNLHSFPTRRSSDLLPPSPTKSSNLSETAEVPACNVPSRSPLPALAIAPETKLGTASSGLGTLRSEERFSRNAETDLVCRLLLEKKKPAGGDHADHVAAGERQHIPVEVVHPGDKVVRPASDR